MNSTELAETLTIPITVMHPETANLIDWRSWDSSDSNAIHEKESKAISNLVKKRDMSFLRYVLDGSWQQAPVFGMKVEIRHLQKKRQKIVQRIVAKVEDTQQDYFYVVDHRSNSAIAELSIGDKYIFKDIIKAKINPNKTTFELRQNRNILVITGVKKAIPVPAQWGIRGVAYLIPKGTEVKLTKVTQETWDCSPDISCKTHYENINIYYLHAVE